jgi:hypothetical protein
MSSTESAAAERLALAAFDDLLVPAAAAHVAAGQSYFARGRDATVASYFGPPTRAVLTPEDFDYPVDGAQGLLDAAAGYWALQGEERLVSLVPALRAIATALRDEPDGGDGSVDIMCYTMF